MDGQTIISAFTHILYQIVYFLFILPFDTWLSAIKRLAAQRENKALKVTEIKSPWPMFTFLKRWCIDFFFDMLIALAWIIGLIIAFKFGWFKSKPGIIILTILAIYCAPVAVHIVRDFFVLLLKPFTKFLGWLNKPAQHLDITIDKEVL